MYDLFYTKLIWPGYSPFVDGFLILYQCGICACYVVFVAANLCQVIEAETDFRVDLRLHMLFYFIPMALIMCFRNLKVLAPCSALANALILICIWWSIDISIISYMFTRFFLTALIVIMYYVFRDFPDTSDRLMVGDFKGFPLFIGTTLFALEAVGVVRLNTIINIQIPTNGCRLYPLSKIWPRQKVLVAILAFSTFQCWR